jgi:serine/threonine-protein kinase
MTFGLAAGSRVGSYRITSVIAARALGVVYRGEHARLGTPVAIKVLAPHLSVDPVFREQVFRDVNQVVAIEHPNLVPILDADVHDDLVYIVMRHVAGPDLGAVLARAGPLAPDRAHAVISPVASALDALHARRIVHGRVKPSNVLIAWTRDGTIGHVYLSDAGLSGETGSARTLPSVQPEDLDHVSPEQIGRLPLSPRSDVYALGSVAHHALTGRVPYSDAVGGSALEAHMERPPPAATTVRPGLPPAVDEPLLQAMARDPARRPASCGAFASALAAALEQPATEAVAPPAARVVPPPPPVPEPGPSPPAAASSSPPPADTGPRPARRRPGRKRAGAVAIATLLAAVAGYGASQLLGGDDGGAPETPQATGPLAGIVRTGLPSFRCTVTDGPPGGTVVRRATCAPAQPGHPGIRRVTLTQLTSREALDKLFTDARALTPELAGATGGCGPGTAFGGSGRWFEDASGTSAGGRVFCYTPRRQGTEALPTVVWTVNDSTLLAEAAAPSSVELAHWWANRRHLAPGQRPRGRAAG